MADSDRSRSPMPGRNRSEPHGPAQPVRQELSFFPRWCGPMQAAVWHSQQMSRPQFRRQFTMQQSGPYMPNRSTHQNPPVLRAHGPVNGSHQHLRHHLHQLLHIQFLLAKSLHLAHPHYPVHKHNQCHQALHPSHHLNLVHSTLHKRPHQEAKRNWIPMAVISILIGKRTKTTMTTRRSTA